MIHLQEISPENFWDVISLSVRPDQDDLVTSNAVSVAQSKVQPECIPLAIYADAEPVGFVMYCLDRDDGEYWIYRLMIDQKHQGKGYGKEGLQQVLNRIRQDTQKHAVYLGVDRRGEASVALYQAASFQFTGQVFGKEHIMKLEY